MIRSRTTAALGLAAVCVAVAACGGGTSEQAQQRTVAAALAANPLAAVTAVGGGGVTVSLDHKAVATVPAAGQVAVPMLVSNRSNVGKLARLKVALDPGLSLASAEPALPRSGPGQGWSCQAASCSYLKRADNGATRPVELAAGAQMATTLDVAAAANAGAGTDRRVSVSSGEAGPQAAPQFTVLRVVPHGHAAPKLILQADGTASGVEPGGEGVASYQVVNDGSAPVAPGSLTVDHTLPAGLAKSWTVASRSWRCSAGGERSVPTCRLRRGLGIGEQAPDLVIAYQVASTARGALSWTAVARAGASRAGLPLQVNVQANAPAPSKPFAFLPKPGLTVGAKLNDSLRRTGAAPLEVTVLNSADRVLRSPISVRVGLPSGLKATTAGAAGWTCRVNGGRTVACRQRRASTLRVDAAIPAITVNLSVARNARSGGSITAVATSGSLTGSTAIRPEILSPFAVQASAVPAVLADPPKKPTERMARATGGVNAQQGILSATPSDQAEPGVEYRWHQQCTAKADVRVVPGCRAVVPRVTWLAPTRDGDAIGQTVRYVPPRLPDAGTLRFTVSVTGAGNPASGSTTVQVVLSPPPVVEGHPVIGRPTPPMPGYRQINLARATGRQPSPRTVQPAGGEASHPSQGSGVDLIAHDQLPERHALRPLVPLARGETSTVFCDIFDQVSRSGEVRNVALREGLTADFLAARAEGGACTDADARVTFAAPSVFRVGAFAFELAAGAVTSGGVSITAATLSAPRDWGTLPFRVDDKRQLEIRFGAGSEVEPLAGVVTAPTFAILPLVPPMGIRGTHTTDLIFDANAAGNQRVAIAASAADDGASAALNGTVGLNGTFDADAVERGVLKVGDCSMDVAGTVRRAAEGQPIARELTGTVPACHPFSNVALTKGTGTWSDAGIGVDATVAVAGPGGHDLPLRLSGTISDLSTWTLKLETGKDFAWEPAEFLRISGLGGRLIRDNGKTTFSVDGTISSWKVNDNLVFGKSGVRITNECPAGQTCKGVSVRFDLSGAFYPRYALSWDLHVDFTAAGAVELPSGAISMSAQPSLESIPFGTFTLTKPKLGLADAGPSADGSGRHTIAVTLSATAGIWGQDFNVRGAFSEKGYYFVGALGDLAVVEFKEANVVYSSYDQDLQFGEGDRGYKLRLKAGNPQLGASFPIPQLLAKLFQDKLLHGYVTAALNFDEPIGSLAVQAQVHFNTRESDIYLLGSKSSLIALKTSDPHLEINYAPPRPLSIGIAANVSFKYPKLSGGETGSLDLDMLAEFSTKAITGSISNLAGWDPFLGIPGFNVKKFAISLGYTAGSPEPSFGIAGTVSVPGWLAAGLNLTAGTDVSLAMKLDPAQPCLAMGVSRADKGNAIDLLQQGLVTAKQASFVIAPRGCDIGRIHYPTGGSIDLDARIFGVETKFSANVALEGDFAMKANVDIGEWDIMNIVGMEKTHLDLDVSTGAVKKFVVAFSGGVHVLGAIAHVQGKLSAKYGLASLDLKGLVEGAELGAIKIPGTATFDLNAAAELGPLGALKSLDTTMDADMNVLGNGMHMHFALQYANLKVIKAEASARANLDLKVAKLTGQVAIGYSAGKGTAGYDGRLEVFGYSVAHTGGTLDASLSKLAIDAELVDLHSPWIGIYLVNFRGNVNVHIRGTLSFGSDANLGASGRAEIEGEVCYFFGCSGFGSIGVSPEFNFNPFRVRLCASLPVIGWQCISFGSGPEPQPFPKPEPVQPVPAYLPPGALIRMYSPTLHLHAVTRGGVGLSTIDWSKSPWNTYSYESALGFVSPRTSPGQRYIYSCDGGDNRQFVSLTDGCGGGARSLGAIGAVWINKPSGTGLEYRQLFACSDGPVDHFVSSDPKCEGRKTDYELGWVPESQPRLFTYINQAGIHTVTSRLAGPEAGRPIDTVGFLLPEGGPGRVALYACQLKTGNKPRFLSADERCGGERTIGVEGWVWSSAGERPALPREEISMCRRVLPNGDLDYVVDGGTAKCGPSLGYIDQTQPGLDRFYDGSHHWVSTQAVPPQYKFEQNLGYLLQSPGEGRAALYSCIDGAQQFLSLEPGCGGKRLEGLEGWVYRARPAGPPTLPVYSCAIGADRFASFNSGCEGQRTLAELGYVLQFPPA